jgi:hypothetical protein
VNTTSVEIKRTELGWARWVRRATIAWWAGAATLLLAGVLFPTPDRPCNDLFYGLDGPAILSACAGGGPRFGGLTLNGFGRAQEVLLTAAICLAIAGVVAVASSRRAEMLARTLPARFVARLSAAAFAALGLMLTYAGVVELVLVPALAGLGFLGAAAVLMRAARVPTRCALRVS